MSENTVFPIDKEVAAELVRAALVPQAVETIEQSPWGYFVLHESVTRDMLSGCVAALGAFDGFHLGHAELLSGALKNATDNGAPLVALTFWPDPSETLGHPEGRLMDIRQRVDSLVGAGASAVAVLRFNESLAHLSPDAFVNTFCDLLAPIEVHVGENFRFGYKGQGTTDDLATCCSARGVRVCVHETFEVTGAPVSATRIRNLISEGAIEEAQALLGRPLSLFGTVEHGRGEGTGFGFATANLIIEKERVLLAPGVYAGYTVVNGKAWPTAANAGSPASFGGGEDNLIEAHLVGFSETIYGEIAAFVPICLLRKEQRFRSREELVNTVRGNIEWVAKNLGTEGLEVFA